MTVDETNDIEIVRESALYWNDQARAMKQTIAEQRAQIDAMRADLESATKSLATARADVERGLVEEARNKGTLLVLRLQFLKSCCLASQEIPDDCRVFAWSSVNPDPDSGDSEEAALFWSWEERKPRWWVLEAWEDNTGHGCYCCAALSSHATRSDAIRLGLSDRGRKLLGLEIE